MRTMTKCLAVSLLLACGGALADGAGTLYHNGKVTALEHAYAWPGPDPFDKTRQITTVVFADRPIDAAALRDERDRGHALETMLRGATRVDLNIEADGSVQNVNLRLGDTFGSQSGSGWYTLDLKRNDAQRIEGSFRSNNESDKQDGSYYDLRFALDLPGPADPGVALPAGGGDLGKAYLAHLAALRKGDVDALVGTMTRERAAELQAHRNDADFKMMFGFIQSQALRAPKYVAGHVKGDSATLDYQGKDADGKAVVSTVSMRSEDGAWKVEKESTQAGG